MEVLTWLNYIYWSVVYLPLWKIWLRHLGRWHSQYMQKQKMFQTTNHIYIYIFIYVFNWRKWGLVAIYPPTVNVQTEISNVHQNRLSKSWNADLGIKNRCVTREYMKNERATVQTWSITQNRVFLMGTWYFWGCPILRETRQTQMMKTQWPDVIGKQSRILWTYHNPYMNMIWNEISSTDNFMYSMYFMSSKWSQMVRLRQACVI